MVNVMKQAVDRLLDQMWEGTTTDCSQKKNRLLTKFLLKSEQLLLTFCLNASEFSWNLAKVFPNLNLSTEDSLSVCARII